MCHVTNPEEKPKSPLKLLRKAKRGDARRVGYLTQREVADAAGLDRSLYNALERGKRPLSVGYARLLAPILGDEVWQFVTGVPPPQPPPEDQTTLLAELEDRVGVLEGGIRRMSLRETEVAAELKRLDVRVTALEPPSEADGRQQDQDQNP